MKLIRQSLVPNLKFWAFLVSCFERIEIFFFQLQSNEKIKNSIIFELDGMFEIRLLQRL